MRRTQQKPIAMSDDMIEAVERFASQKHINFSQAVRHLLESSLDTEAARANQDMIRQYIHEEINNSLGPYMSQLSAAIERRIQPICEKASRTSAIAFALLIGMLTENYTDGRTHEELLSVAIRYADRFLNQDPRNSELYKAEARELLQRAYGLSKDMDN